MPVFRPTRVVPDRALRAGRRLVGAASLRAAVSGRVVLVNGAHEGVGRDVARHLQAAGAIVLGFEVADPEAAAHAAAVTIEREGRVDVLVNAPPPLADRVPATGGGADDLAHRALTLGYYAPVRLILAVVPAMRMSGRGHVVNVCLEAGGAREPGCAAQIAAATALDAFGRCLAPELDEARIPITSVHVPLVPDERAARRVCEAIVHRSKRIGTPWGAPSAAAIVARRRARAGASPACPPPTM